MTHYTACGWYPGKHFLNTRSWKRLYSLLVVVVGWGTTNCTDDNSGSQKTPFRQFLINFNKADQNSILRLSWNIRLRLSWMVNGKCFRLVNVSPKCIDTGLCEYTGKHNIYNEIYTKKIIIINYREEFPLTWNDLNNLTSGNILLCWWIFQYVVDACQ